MVVDGAAEEPWSSAVTSRRGEWTLVGVHPLRSSGPHERFQLPAGGLLIARDLRHGDGQLLSELIVADRLPELTDADWRRDDPLRDLLDGLPRPVWEEHVLDTADDSSDEVYVLHRYPSDREEYFPRRTAVGLQAIHSRGRSRR